MRNLKTILQYNKYFILLLIILFLYILTYTKLIKYQSKYEINTKEIYGIITSIKINGDKLTLEVKGKEKILANYYIKTEEEKEKIVKNINHGDKVLLKGTLNIPSNNTIPNNFNYKKYLYNKKIYYTFNIDKYKIVNENNNIFYKVKDIIYKRAYKMDNNDYYLSFILGDKSLLSSETYENFQTNGVSHVLALSGMHINILLAIINIFLKNIKEIYKIIITSIILIMFLLLTGVSASLERATIFYILKNINKHYNLNYSNIKILFMCAFIILIINPFMIYDLGFIYSFLICFGIFYYHDFIKGKYFTKLFKLSLITFLFSLPITALINHEINLSSILINIIIVPWISLIVYPLAIISFIFPLLNHAFTLSINITTFLNMTMKYLSIIINVPKIPIVLIILFYVILLLRKKKIYKYLILLILIPKLIFQLDRNYYVYFFDVGQGDSALLVSPYQKEVIMIDTGGKVTYEKEKWQISSKNYNISDGVIKFLKSIGVTKIDYLVLSHGDQDHAGDADNIINHIKVSNLVLNNGSLNELEKNIVSKNINITNNYNLKYFNIINLNNETEDNENDNSIVNYISFLNYQFLFMGDAPKSIEEKILKKYNLKNIDVIKIGHHGSKTSTDKDFINKIKPKYSIISVGRLNRYNHPHEETLKNLKNSNILRTDLDGTIIMKIKNKINIKLCKL